MFHFRKKIPLDKLNYWNVEKQDLLFLYRGFTKREIDN